MFDDLEVDEDVREELHALTPTGYTGVASEQSTDSSERDSCGMTKDVEEWWNATADNFQRDIDTDVGVDWFSAGGCQGRCVTRAHRELVRYRARRFHSSVIPASDVARPDVESHEHSCSTTTSATTAAIWSGVSVRSQT